MGIPIEDLAHVVLENFFAEEHLCLHEDFGFSIHGVPLWEGLDYNQILRWMRCPKNN